MDIQVDILKLWFVLQFFSTTTPELDAFLQSLCTGLYDVLRPLIIHIDHLETLSELCNILRRG